jgi:hypothetical protein
VRHGHDFADLEHIDTEQLGLAQAGVAAQPEQQQLELDVAGEVSALVDHYLRSLGIEVHAGPGE